MRKVNVTDGRTGGVAISPVPGPTGPAGDNYIFVYGILKYRKIIIFSNEKYVT